MTTKLVYAASLFQCSLYISYIGCFALHSSCPTPFVQLVALLYSDKKTGEVASIHRRDPFNLYLPSSKSLPASKNGSPLSGSNRHQETWECELETSLGMSNLKPHQCHHTACTS